MKNLITDFSGNATDTAFSAFDWDGSEPIITVWAQSFGGGTVAIEMSPDGGTTWIALTTLKNTAASFTANSTIPCYAVSGAFKIRAHLTGATAASHLNVTASG